eukprot:TRINITY_DN4953_c0_g1_i2.p1 TRINITY_DN4953_c0_g1~~TRINITY_DN4953_c0_g1_i2.p1  ORF type:complete len:242 (+),score=35.05 TRINITY_DN4953_c0_g1_i2:95-820(+)
MCGEDPHRYGFPSHHYDGVAGWCVNGPPLNMANPELYVVIGKLLSELAITFHDNFLHLGGDELAVDCYLEGASQPPLDSFYDRVLDILKPLHRTPVFYEESIGVNASFPPGTIFETWMSDTLPKQVIDKGFRLLAGRSKWYLEYERDWHAFYENHPVFETLGDQIFVGAETMMWGEFADKHNWFGKVFPPAAAVAEVMWARPPKDSKLVDTFVFFSHLCGMQRRGIPVTSPGPGCCVPQMP